MIHFRIRAEKAEAECERLQAELKITTDRAAHNAEQDAAREQILREELTRWQKIAIDERAKILFYIQYEENPLEQFGLQSEEVKKKYRDQAARELGIAPADQVGTSVYLAKGKLPILTAKQRAALQLILDRSEFDQSLAGSFKTEKEILRSMLTQSRSAWEITEKRKAFLLEIESLLEENGFVAKAAMLRAMLAEARP